MSNSQFCPAVREMGAVEVFPNGEKKQSVLLGFDVSGETPKPVVFPEPEKGSRIILETRFSGGAVMDNVRYSSVDAAVETLK